MAASNLRESDLGVRAAVEVSEESDRLQGTERGLLPCEESAAPRPGVVNRQRLAIRDERFRALRHSSNARIEGEDDALAFRPLRARRVTVRAAISTPRRSANRPDT